MKLQHLIIIFLLSFSPFTRADILLIVNAKNSIDKLEKKQVIDLYMGRVSVYPNQQPAQIFDIKEGSPLREIFYRLLTGKTEAQVDAYWATLLFAGKMAPPKQLSSEKEVIDAVHKNPHGMAYVRSQNLPTTVKVVFEISDNDEQ